MSQIKLLKLDAEGLPTEFDVVNDEITLKSFSVTGGPVLSDTGLDLNNKAITEALSLSFQDPSTATINQTAGTLIIDNLVAKDRDNEFGAAASLLFPVITDAVGAVDAFRLPALAGTPTVTPTTSGEGFLVWDSTADKQWAWTGTAWKDLSIASAANTVKNTYTAAVALAANDLVYIDATGKLDKVTVNQDAKRGAVGVVDAAALANGSVSLVSEGVQGGFSGLTPGARYYASASTPGGVQLTAPSTSGNNIIQVGYAKSATEIQLQVEFLGKKA